MTIDFAEILEDLELKRAAARPAGAHPLPDLADAGLELVVTTEDGGDEPFRSAHAAHMVTQALGDLAHAHGEEESDTAAGRALVRATTARVVERLRADGATRLTVHDLSALVEATLIEAGQYEVAKALVMRRGQANVAVAPPSDPLRLIRRSGDVVAWSPSKIEVAIRKAFLSLQLDPSPAITLTARTNERIGSLGQAYVPIEAVQDIVQEELVLAGHMRVAERYIVYRAERALLRAQQADGTTPAPPATIAVLDADGTEASWDGRDLRLRIDFASIGLDLDLGAEELERELRRSIRPGVRRADLQRLVILNAKALVERDSELSRFAGRILLSSSTRRRSGGTSCATAWAACATRIAARCGRCSSAASRSAGSTPRCSTTTSTVSRPRSTRPPIWTSTSSGCKRCMTAT